MRVNIGVQNGRLNWGICCYFHHFLAGHQFVIQNDRLSVLLLILHCAWCISPLNVNIVRWPVDNFGAGHSEESTLLHCIQCGTSGDGLAWVCGPGCAHAESLFDKLNNFWDSGSTSNQLDCINFNALRNDILFQWSKQGSNWIEHIGCFAVHDYSSKGLWNVLIFHETLNRNVGFRYSR